jgi:hypothetical protein
MIKRVTCRISGEPLVPLFSLGDLYVSDFLPAGEEPTKESKVPLTLALAPKSGLVQLVHTAPSDSMYRRYWYRSGTNASMKAALKDIAEKVTFMMKPGAGDVWVDIGANDGTLLSFVPKEMIRIGFDPARNTFMEAESKKHATEIVVDYFTHENYTKSAAKNKKAKIVTSIAMFYDLEDPNTFVADVKTALDDEGMWVIQMSYLPLMLEQLAFDNICHEHLEYYSLTSLKHLLDQHDLAIVDAEMNDVNGGSFRIYIRKNAATPERFATAPYRDVAQMRVAQMLAHEDALNLKDPKTYAGFFARAEKLKTETMSFIKAEKAKGKHVWGYGASTKGNTLLQWYGLDHTMIDAIAERAEIKFGHRTVGTNIPIVSEDEMRKAKPDYLLILPWHFIHEFRQRESDYLKSGGHFIVPCPRFEIIGA